MSDPTQDLFAELRTLVNLKEGNSESETLKRVIMHIKNPPPSVHPNGSCHKHRSCAQAEKIAKEQGKTISHCHDPWCEDCITTF